MPSEYVAVAVVAAIAEPDDVEQGGDAVGGCRPTVANIRRFSRPVSAG